MIDLIDLWREIPTQDSYPGLTELTRDGRTIASVGTGARVRQAIVEAMEKRIRSDALDELGAIDSELL